MWITSAVGGKGNRNAGVSANDKGGCYGMLEDVEFIIRLWKRLVVRLGGIHGDAGLGVWKERNARADHMDRAGVGR
jgi:hypothetical protein